MYMRSLINIVEGDPSDWRAWITANGQIRDITDDLTHAEDVQSDFPMSDDERHTYNHDEVEAAFAKASAAGWIRVGINYANFEFYAHCEPDAVTTEALYSLARVVNDKYADTYFLEAGQHDLDGGNIHQMKAAIKSLVRAALRREVTNSKGPSM